jgi:formylglycine-generating enzyme required for sulfatase activity
VLEQFGRSLGQLPSDTGESGREASLFLDQAAEKLAGPDGHVIPVRLSLFAEVVRLRPWTRTTLRIFGGVEGIEAKFLEEAFESASAPPGWRVHRSAAEAVLKALLPPPASVIRGHPRPSRFLREAAGYTDRPVDFAELIRVLDHDLRLITSTDLEGVSASEPGPAPNSAAGPADTYYQLAHDYLIRPVRQWLERKQRSTRAGRARLRLEAITAAWLERPGRRLLPSPLECLGILWHTRPGRWSVDERRLMRATAGHYLTRGAATVAVVAALAIGAKTWWEREQRRTKLTQAFTANDRDLAELFPDLIPHRGLVITELEEIENDPKALDHRREVATVLLYKLAPTAKRGEYLGERLLAATEPDKLELIRGTLAASPGHAPGKAFWEVLLSRVASPQQRLRAAAAIARLEPTEPHWSAGGPIVAAALLNEDRRAIPRWIELLEPVLPSIAPSLGKFFRNNQLDSATRSAASEAIAETLGRLRDGPALAALAADPGSESLRSLVQEFQRLDQPVQVLGSVLAAMTADADPEAFRLIIRELDRLGRPASAVEALEKVLAEPRPRDPAARERTIRRQVNAALALLVLGRLDRIPPLLSHFDAPRLRALLIDQFGQVKGQIQPLLDYLQLARAGDPVVLQAVLLAVAEIKSRTEENRTRIETGIDRDPFTSLDVEKLLEGAADLYRNHSHPGVHSAAELVLRRWGREQTLAQCDGQSRSNPRHLDGPGWELGPQGHTLALLPAPLEFWMGSPDDEEGRFPHERRHYRRIDRSLAVATKEVTIAQYRAFKSGYRQDTRYTREADCPVNTLSWYEAAEYCNWLSEKAGIAQCQWCYPIKIESGMVVPGDSVDRHGYRLPTEAEWEYICRAETETARPFGDSDDVLPRYALTSMTPGDRTRPVGRLLPNEFGLFDILGNVWEWCHDGQANQSADPYPRYPDGTTQHPAPDLVRTTTVDSTLRRMLRGGAFDYAPAQARSAHRYSVSPAHVEGTFGFRVVRTLPSRGGTRAAGGS